MDRPQMALIVDDEETIRYVLAQGLTDIGYECVDASGGQEALEQLASQKFQLAILDVKMPGISGLELMKMIRSSYPDTCVIMLSAVEHPDVAARTVISLGADAFISKPWTLDELRVTVQRTMHERESVRAPA